MEYHLQILGQGIYMVLRGSEGMVEAADQYCDAKDALELSGYVEWIGGHDLGGRLLIRPDLKGILSRRRAGKVVREINALLQQYGALIPEEKMDRKEIEYALLHRDD